MMGTILTFRFRLKDKHASNLNRKARACSFVWNYCNDTQQTAVRWGRKWLTGYDLGRLCSGSSKELGVSADTIERVCIQYAQSRRQKRRPWLRFRGKKSLGWVPFKDGTVRVNGQAFVYHGQRYDPMHWRDFPEGAKIRCGSFSQDSRGRWYINCPVEVPFGATAKHSAIGIDLGLKDLATLSNGEKIENPRWYRELERRHAMAQRAKKLRLTRSIAAKIKNCREDFLHKVSARIALDHDLIVVGNISGKKLAQTKLAKSVMDAGWSTFRKMLSYKAIRHKGRMIEVDERMTSQVCSACGATPEGRPKGIADLGVRAWACSECGTVHNRDVNAAKNILRLGQQSLAEGAST